MYSEELFRILQDGFAKHHPKFNFSKKSFEEAPEKIRLTTGYAANVINEVIKSRVENVIIREQNWAEDEIKREKSRTHFAIAMFLAAIVLNVVVILFA